MKMTRVSFLVVLLFSLLPIHAAAGSKSKVFSVPADVLFNAAVETAALNYSLSTSDAGHLRFSFVTGVTKTSWGLYVDASVESLTEKSSRMVLAISNASPKQLFSWGAGGRMAGDFFRDVENAVASWRPVQYRLTMLKPAESESLSYSDDNLGVVFQFCHTSIDFRLTNKTESPLKIEWNQWAYVDTASMSHKVLHKGIPYKDRESSVPPSTVPPMAAVEESIVPTDYVEWNEFYDVGGGFRTRELLPYTSAASQYVGKTVSVFMPVEVNGSVKNYVFLFNIKDVQVGSR